MMLRAATVLLLCALMSSAAVAEKRVALVIGNGAYVRSAPLPNPSRDADAVASLFRAAGFDVVEAKRDLGVVAMRRTLRDFSDRVIDADIATVFYAGHGIEVSGTNYLIPVDAVLERDMDVEDETVSLERIVLVLEKAKRLRLIILDACRDNPFVRSMKRTLANRSIGRGLAQVDVLSSDTLVAFAAKAGSTAEDGNGTNSPYTIALVKHLTTPGLDLRLALGRVRDEVLKATANRQEPFVYGSLGGSEIALVPPAKMGIQPPPPAAPADPAPAVAAREWQDVKETKSIEVLERYKERHKDDPVYAALAQDRIDTLKRAHQGKPEAGVSRKPEAELPAKPKAEPPAKNRGSADVRASRPNALSYSASVWAPGSIPTNQTVTRSTPYGTLTCRGGWGGANGTGRVCSWD
jgi:hypothetical protein